MLNYNQRSISRNFKNRITTFVTAFLSFSFFISAYAMDALDQEYQRHQQVSKRFFARISKNPDVRKAIEQFKQELDNDSQLTSISLDGLSSRTRILLWRELTALSNAQSILIPFVFHTKKFEINFGPSLKQPGNGEISTIGSYEEIKSVMDQGSCDGPKRWAQKLLDARKATDPYHSKIVRPIMGTKGEAILSTKGRKVNLEILNILLDFEVARRLQGTGAEDKKSAEETVEFADALLDMATEQFYNSSDFYYRGERTEFKGDVEKGKKEFIKSFQENYNSAQQVSIFTEEFSEKIELNKIENAKKEKAVLQKSSSKDVVSKKLYWMEKSKEAYDEVPVGSAIIGMLRLSSSGIKKFSDFFHAPEVYKVKDHEFRYGPFNAFQGAAEPNHREQAVKNILQIWKNGQASTLEQIHKEYLVIFGGEDESCGEEYYTLST